MSNPCPFTHLSGFEHLEVEFGFDLGYKFEGRDARIPFWMLYVSYEAIEGPVVRGTLYFHHRRPADVDGEVLRGARPFITDALRVLSTGKALTFATQDNPQLV